MKMDNLRSSSSSRLSLLQLLLLLLLVILQLVTQGAGDPALQIGEDEAKADRRRGILDGPRKSIPIGVYMDCSYYAKYQSTMNEEVMKNSVRATLSSVNAYFSLGKGGPNIAFYVPEDSWEIDNAGCSMDLTSFRSNCDSGLTPHDRLENFGIWRAARASGEGIWMLLTNCYPIGEGGASLPDSVCTTTGDTTASVVVVAVQSVNRATEVNYARQLAQTMGAQNEFYTSCLSYGNYIMAEPRPTSPSANVAFSSCSKEDMAEYIDSNSPSCFQPYVHKAILSVSPNPVPKILNSETYTFTLGNTDYLGASNRVGLSDSTACTNILSFVFLASASGKFNIDVINVGDYYLCFSNDNGKTYFTQENNPKISIVEATPTTITAITPDVMGINTLPTITFTGAYTFNGSKVAFTKTSCTAMVNELSLSGSNVQPIPNMFTEAGVYTLCYSTDGTNFVLQSNVNLFVIVISTNLITNLSPSIVAANTNAVLSTTDYVDAETAVIGFTVDICSGALEGVSDLDDKTGFTLTTGVTVPGVYKVCYSLDNGANFVEQTGVTITFADVPEAPTNLDGETTASIATITFDAPSSNGFSEILDYVVTLDDGKSDLITKTIGATTTTVKVTQLVADTSYTVRAYAVNSIGKSVSSSSIVISTADATAPGAPSSVVATPSRDDVYLNWMAPEETGGKAITEYSVTVAGVYPITGESHQLTKTSGTNSVTVNGLFPRTDYNMTVLAKNSAGSGTPLVSTFSTLPGSPPFTPVEVHAKARTRKAITVAWKNPSDPGNAGITKHHIVYADKEDMVNKTISIGGETEYTFGNLDSFTTLYAYIQAENSYGKSSFSDVVEVETFNGESWIEVNMVAFIIIIVVVPIAVGGFIITALYQYRKYKLKKRKILELTEDSMAMQ